MFIVMCICVIVYWSYEAVTEVTLHRNVQKPGSTTAGTYHRYRLLEAAGIAGITIFGSYSTPQGIWTFLGIVGIWGLGWTVYEGIFSTMVGDGLWNKRYTWDAEFFGRLIQIQLGRRILIPANILSLLILAIAFSFGTLL